MLWKNNYLRRKEGGKSSVDQYQPIYNSVHAEKKHA